jgi:hypothetical protein
VHRASSMRLLAVVASGDGALESRSRKFGQDSGKLRDSHCTPGALAELRAPRHDNKATAPLAAS